MKTKTIRKGIWTRKTVTISSSDRIEEIEQFFADRPRDNEEGFLRNILSIRSGAKQVLVDAGYPGRECVYKNEKSGKNWVPRDPEDDDPSGFMWPFFDDIVPLSAEMFARNVIYHIDGILLRVYRDEDIFLLMYNWLRLLSSYRHLVDEVHGVAAWAHSGRSARRGASEGGKAKARRHTAEHSKWRLKGAEIRSRHPNWSKFAIASQVKKQLCLTQTPRHIARFIK